MQRTGIDPRECDYLAKLKHPPSTDGETDCVLEIVGQTEKLGLTWKVGYGLQLISDRDPVKLLLPLFSALPAVDGQGKRHSIFDCCATYWNSIIRYRREKEPRLYLTASVIVWCK